MPDSTITLNKPAGDLDKALPEVLKRIYIQLCLFKEVTVIFKDGYTQPEVKRVNRWVFSKYSHMIESFYLTGDKLIYTTRDSTEEASSYIKEALKRHENTKETLEKLSKTDSSKLLLPAIELGLPFPSISVGTPINKEGTYSKDTEEDIVMTGTPRETADPNFYDHFVDKEGLEGYTELEFSDIGIDLKDYELFINNKGITVDDLILLHKNKDEISSTQIAAATVNTRRKMDNSDE